MDAVALFRREKMSPEARVVADSFTMVNTSPEFDDATAEAYMEQNRPHFAADVSHILAKLNLPRA